MRLEKGTFGLFAAKQLSGIPALEQAVFSWIAFYKNQDGSFPSVDTLCTVTGTKSRATIRKAVTSLMERGFLIVERRKRENGSDTTNNYVPLFLDEQEIAPSEPVPEAIEGGDQKLRGEGSKIDPPLTKESLTKEISKKINKKREHKEPIPITHEIDPATFAHERIPELAEGESFMREWLEFCRLRLSPPKPKRPAPLSVRAAEIITAKLKRWGRRAAILSLQKSIVGPWQDVFWPKELGPEPPPGIAKNDPATIRSRLTPEQQREYDKRLAGVKPIPASTYDQDLRARAEAGDQRAIRILETKR